MVLSGKLAPYRTPLHPYRNLYQSEPGFLEELISPCYLGTGIGRLAHHLLRIALSSRSGLISRQHPDSFRSVHSRYTFQAGLASEDLRGRKKTDHIHLHTPLLDQRHLLQRLRKTRLASCLLFPACHIHPLSNGRILSFSAQQKDPKHKK